MLESLLANLRRVEAGVDPPRLSWDFERVKKEHLFACFVWEYYIHIPGYIDAVKAYEQERGRLFRAATKIEPGNPPLPSPASFGLHSHPSHGDFLEYWPHTPFLGLPEDVCDCWLLYQGDEYHTLIGAMPPIAFDPTAFPIMADLGPLIPKIQDFITEKGFEVLSRYSSGGLLEHLAGSDSEQLVGFIVDWRFSDNQLKEAFEAWLRRFAPTSVPRLKLDGKGNPAEQLRALLKKLGAYRLLAALKDPAAAYQCVQDAFYPESPQQDGPEDVKKRELYSGDPSTWNKARDRAASVIQKLGRAVMIKSLG